METYQYNIICAPGSRAGPAAPVETRSKYPSEPKIGLNPKGIDIWNVHKIPPRLQPDSGEI